MYTSILFRSTAVVLSFVSIINAINIMTALRFSCITKYKYR